MVLSLAWQWVSAANDLDTARAQLRALRQSLHACEQKHLHSEARAKVQRRGGRRRLQAEPTTHRRCQTRCDRECTRFDGCRGEAWVCINLYDLLDADSLGTTGLFDNQCFAEAPRSTRAAVRELARQHLTAALGEDSHPSLSPTSSLLPYAPKMSQNVGLAFKAAVERYWRADGGQWGRRVPVDALLSASRSALTLRQLARRLTQAECQRQGLPLTTMARERTFNRSWHTFRGALHTTEPRNLAQDAVLFMMDLMVQHYGVFNKIGCGRPPAPPDSPPRPRAVALHRHGWVRACMRVCACAHVRACARVRACVRACVRVCICARVHACVNVCVRMCVRARVCLRGLCVGSVSLWGVSAGWAWASSRILLTRL